MEFIRHISFAKQDPDTILFLQNVCHPDKLMDLIIKGKISLVLSAESGHQEIPNCERHGRKLKIYKILNFGKSNLKSCIMPTKYSPFQV